MIGVPREAVLVPGHCPPECCTRYRPPPRFRVRNWRGPSCADRKDLSESRLSRLRSLPTNPWSVNASLTILKDHLRQVRPMFLAAQSYKRTSYSAHAAVCVAALDVCLGSGPLGLAGAAHTQGISQADGKVFPGSRNGIAAVLAGVRSPFFHSISRSLPGSASSAGTHT
jgi:hypothetical protein